MLLEKLYDPISPSYHRYLTTEQLTDAFGPTKEDEQAVIAFTTSNGFEVVETCPNRLLVEVTAPATNVERAFKLTISLYQDPINSRIFSSS